MKGRRRGKEEEKIKKGRKERSKLETEEGRGGRRKVNMNHQIKKT